MNQRARLSSVLSGTVTILAISGCSSGSATSDDVEATATTSSTMDWNSGRVQRRGKNVAAGAPRVALG
jgi:hypothetical protein